MVTVSFVTLPLRILSSIWGIGEMGEAERGARARQRGLTLEFGRALAFAYRVRVGDRTGTWEKSPGAIDPGAARPRQLSASLSLFTAAVPAQTIPCLCRLPPGNGQSRALWLFHTQLC